MIVLIGISCLMMAFFLAFADPVQFNPDPFLQSIVWVCFAIWCFVTAWNRRNWLPPADTAETNTHGAGNSGAPLVNGLHPDSNESLRNPIAALAAVNEHMAMSEDDEQNREHRVREAQRLRDLARDQPFDNPVPESEISVTQALRTPLDNIQDLEQMRAIARKLQAIGIAANGHGR